jgi:hypothetical protein
MVNTKTSGEKEDQRLNEIRELASLSSWKKQRDDGWYDTAPKDDRKRALIRNEKAEEFGLCEAANTDTLDISGWVATSQTKFVKNDVPETTNSTVQLIAFHPPYPSLCYWQNKYHKSCRKRQRGDNIRKADKKRRFVRFTKDDPTIHLLHYALDKKNWYNAIPESETNPISYIRAMNKTAMTISKQIAFEVVTQTTAECSVQTDVSSNMSTRILNTRKRPINRKKMNIPMTRDTLKANKEIEYTTTTNAAETAEPALSYKNFSVTIVVGGEKYTAAAPLPPEAAASATADDGENKGNHCRKIIVETVESSESDAASVVSAKPIVDEITNGFVYTGNPLFKPNKIQKQEYWEHISLVAPKKRLPKKQTEWTPNDTKRFYCSVCDREFAYTPHSSSQIKRHLEKDYHISRL